MQTPELSTDCPTRIELLPKPVEVGQALLPRGTETVLVVAPERAQREYVVWVLREQGYTVREATEGPEAICLFHTNPNRRIDLVIAEAGMPRSSGKTLAHHLTKFLPRSRMVIMSAVTRNDPLDGDLSYFQKPITRTALAYQVRQVLDNAAQAELLAVA